MKVIKCKIWLITGTHYWHHTSLEMYSTKTQLHLHDGTHLVAYIDILCSGDQTNIQMGQLKIHEHQHYTEEILQLVSILINFTKWLNRACPWDLLEFPKCPYFIVNEIIVVYRAIRASNILSNDSSLGPPFLFIS